MKKPEYKGLLPTRFWPELIDDRIRIHGQRVLWEKSKLCPCVRTISGMPNVDIRGNPTCPLCHGTGILYDPPQELICLITNIRRKREFSQIGTYQEGDLLAVIPPRVKVDSYGRFTWQSQPIWDDVGKNDLFTLLNVELRINEVLVRGERDFLLGGRNTALIEVYSIGQSGDQLEEFAEGVDFNFDSNTLTFSWIEGHGPDEGKPYAAVYRGNPVYKVFQELPMPRVPDQGMKLPKRVILRKRVNFRQGEM